MTEHEVVVNLVQAILSTSDVRQVLHGDLEFRKSVIRAAIQYARLIEKATAK